MQSCTALALVLFYLSHPYERIPVWIWNYEKSNQKSFIDRCRTSLMIFLNATLRIQPLLLSMDRETTFPFRIVEASIVLSISAAAICGNSLVAASAVRFQRWNSSINVYIVTLSIVGGIYGTVLPFIVPNIIQHRWVCRQSMGSV